MKVLILSCLVAAALGELEQISKKFPIIFFIKFSAFLFIMNLDFKSVVL